LSLGYKDGVAGSQFSEAYSLTPRVTFLILLISFWDNLPTMLSPLGMSTLSISMQTEIQVFIFLNFRPRSSPLFGYL
jgi:hypothetical protein